MFYDYYAANHFENLRGFIVEYDLRFHDTHPWEIFEVGTGGLITSSRQLATVFIAEKTINSTVEQVPIQSIYRRVYEQTEQEEKTLQAFAEQKEETFQAFVEHLLPSFARTLLRQYLKYLPRADSTRKPWGLKRWDRF